MATETQQTTAKNNDFPQNILDEMNIYNPDNVLNRYIASEEFTDRGLLELMALGIKPAEFTLLNYLFAKFADGSRCQKAITAVVEKILEAGGTPYLMEKECYEGLGTLETRQQTPKGCLSTLNLAILLDNENIVRMLLAAHDRPNKYSLLYVASPTICQLILKAGAVPLQEHVDNMRSVLAACHSTKEKSDKQEILEMLHHKLKLTV